MKSLDGIEFERGYATYHWSGDGYSWPLYSRLFICPWCCRPWARFEVKDCPFHTCSEISCLECNRPTEFNPIPGSLLDSTWGNGIDYTQLNDLHEPLLRREFETTLKAFSNVHDG